MKDSKIGLFKQRIQLENVFQQEKILQENGHDILLFHVNAGDALSGRIIIENGVPTLCNRKPIHIFFQNNVYNVYFGRDVLEPLNTRSFYVKKSVSPSC